MKELEVKVQGVIVTFLIKEHNTECDFCIQ